jgi:hypothetical protein
MKRTQVAFYPSSLIPHPFLPPSLLNLVKKKGKAVMALPEARSMKGETMI